MPRAQAVSLKEFTRAVQSAVKSAIEKHPKFKSDVPQEISTSFLIWGFPVPPDILGTIAVAELQAFSNDVAAGLARFQGGGGVATEAAVRPQGGIYSAGGHIVCGIPPAEFLSLKE